MQRDTAFRRSVGDGPVARVGRVGVDPADRCDDVLAGPQDRDDLVVVGDQRAVHDAVGVQRQHLVGAGGGRDAEILGADDPPDVDTVLVRAVHPAPDEFQLWVIEDALDRRLTHTAGRPLDDTKFGRATHH